MSKSSFRSTTFADALRATHRARRHLQLGNGFSIGASQSFGYPSLYREAVINDPSLERLFAPGDTNFETALRGCSDPKEAARLRAGLIRAVAAVHPSWLSITEEQCRSCRDFLENFVGRNRDPRGSLFTTNYDLLLTWALSSQGKTDGTKQKTQLKCWDGFKSDGEWTGTVVDAYYLHGSVHIFQKETDRPSRPEDTRMLRWEWGRPLPKQVDAHLSADHFPVFVAEGTSLAKRGCQRRWDYLSRANTRFKNVCREPNTVLFTAGHSFGESDNHIAEHISNGTVSDVYMGTFSEADRARARDLAATWAEAREAVGKPGVTVSWFDVRECSIWDGG